MSAIDATFEEALKHPLIETNSSKFDNVHQAIGWMKAHSEEIFIHIDGEIAPLEYLNDRFLSTISDFNQRYQELEWEFFFLALEIRTGKKTTFTLSVTAKERDVAIHHELYYLTLSLDKKFGMLHVPFFASGMADAFMNQTISDKSATTSH